MLECDKGHCLVSVEQARRAAEARVQAAESAAQAAREALQLAERGLRTAQDSVRVLAGSRLGQYFSQPKLHNWPTHRGTRIQNLGGATLARNEG